MIFLEDYSSGKTYERSLLIILVVLVKISKRFLRERRD
jgi:hypothetical protein